MKNHMGYMDKENGFSEAGENGERELMESVEKRASELLEAAESGEEGIFDASEDDDIFGDPEDEDIFGTPGEAPVENAALPLEQLMKGYVPQSQGAAAPGSVPQSAPAPRAVAWADGGAGKVSGSMQAVIPEDMVIHGSVSMTSDIRIYGRIEGDIECEGGVFLLGGAINGNVRCGSLTIQNGSMTGDANVSGDVVLEKQACLKGNITASSIFSNTESEGDIRVSGAASIGEKAFVRGNISAASLSVAFGARIKGMVDITDAEA